MSTVRVSVLERAVAFRRGLETALTLAGFEAVVPADPVLWAGEGPDRMLLITMREPEACTVIERVVASGATVVALLPAPSTAAYSHALRHGAVSAADWNADPEVIVDTVVAAIKGQTVLPIEVARALAQRTSHGHEPVVIPEEVEWLLALSRGRTVVELADDVGFSERSMFRKLHDLYDRLGVTNRSAALLEAERLGLLQPAPDAGATRR
jgi:DNA-binding NarL/FixJ family response regulator